MDGKKKEKSIRIEEKKTIDNKLMNRNLVINAFLNA